MIRRPPRSTLDRSSAASDVYKRQMMHHSKSVYVNLNENDRFITEVVYRDERCARELKSKYPNHIYERSGPIMAKLRAIKSDAEVKQMQVASDITEKAFRRVLGFVRPGVMEYQIEAEITHEFLWNRATGHAYSPIIASGASANVLHYTENNRECKDGDVILMDFGAEYANYAADLTRSIPVNGKFTKRQKDVYNAVLRVMKAATKMLVVGNIIPKYHEEDGKLMEQELIGLGLLKAEDVKKQDPKQPLYKKYFMHGTSHFLGLDVHDICLLYTSPSPRDRTRSRMPSSACKKKQNHNAKSYDSNAIDKQTHKHNNKASPTLIITNHANRISNIVNISQ